MRDPLRRLLQGSLSAFLLATSVPAQEAVRMSLASAEAAESRRKAASTIGYYNMQLGPIGLRFNAGLGIEYSDNVNLNNQNKEGDVSFAPSVNTEMLWPITDQNILHFGVGVGYRAYASHSELDRLFITPGTALTYDLYLGPVWINLHEQLSISDDAVTDPTVSGTGNYSQFQNAIGATATWDMSKVLLRLGYDHANYQTLEGSSAGQHSSSSSELLSCSGGWALGTGSSMGPELSGAFISYSQPSNGTAIQWSAGAYYDAPVSDYVRFRLRAGYTVYETRSGIAAGGTEELSGTYVVLSMAHRLNRMLDYSLSGGRTISFSLFGGPVDAVNVSLGLNWHIMQYTSLGTSFTYDHGKQNLETYDRYGPAISLGRTLTRKLSANLRYQFYERQSNFTTGNYTANIVDLSLSYSF